MSDQILHPHAGPNKQEKLIFMHVSDSSKKINNNHNMQEQWSCSVNRQLKSSDLGVW